MNLLHPYIRGTDKKYGTDENGGFWGENGYNCIEVGYLELDAHNKIIAVHELIPCADVVSIGDIFGGVIGGVNMDCMSDGYLRLFCRGPRELKWESEMIPLSDMRLIYGTPMLPKSSDDKNNEDGEISDGSGT